MRRKQRAAVLLSGVVSWIKPLPHLFSIPGYLDDGQAWPAIWRSIGVAMTPLDWFLTVVGVPCFLYGFRVHTWHQRLRSSISRHQQALNTSKPARPLGKPSSEQYGSPDHTGTITINYNDGKYSIGEGKHKFVIHWGPHNHDTVYLYKVGERGHMVLVTDDEIKDLSSYKKSDRLVIGEGQKAGFQNGHGNWATIEIINAEHKKTGLRNHQRRAQKEGT